MLLQRECLHRLFIFVCTITLLISCHQKPYNSPEGYDLNNPVKFELGRDLVEISGLSFDEDNGNLLAISDSKRHVFEINLKKQKLKNYTDKVVPAQSDLEDLVKLGDSLYLLSSKGIIYMVPPGSKDSTGVIPYPLKLEGDNNFETLYYDPSAKGLIMLCKKCEFEKGQHSRSAFRFDLDAKRFDTTAFYTLSTDEIKKILKDDYDKFEPSAAAIHPISKKLYILVSAGKLLAVADTRGHITEAYNLDPEIFVQPEGIAFAPNGDMFISNEGKDAAATLLLFKYQTPDKTKVKIKK